jgi:hypothetical protein
MQIKKFGFDFFFYRDLIISRTNDRSIKVYDTSQNVMIAELTDYGSLQFIDDGFLFTSDADINKIIYKIDLIDFAPTLIANGSKDSINILSPNLISEVSNLPDYNSHREIYLLSGDKKIMLPENLLFDKCYINGDFFYSNPIVGKSKITCVMESELKLIWTTELNNYKSEVPAWCSEDQDLSVHSDFKFFDNTIILSIGTPFEQRLASFSCADGSLQWISKEYNSTGIFAISKGVAYSVYNNRVIAVDCTTGLARMVDISEQARKVGITLSHNFSLHEKYICGADFKTLKLAALNIETWEFEFVHQFVKGKDIDKAVWQIGVPRLYIDHIYVLDSESTLHILPFSPGSL